MDQNELVGLSKNVQEIWSPRIQRRAETIPPLPSQPVPPALSNPCDSNLQKKSKIKKIFRRDFNREPILQIPRFKIRAHVKYIIYKF